MKKRRKRGVCKNCGKEYGKRSLSGTSKFCSKDCRNTYRQASRVESALTRPTNAELLEKVDLALDGLKTGMLSPAQAQKFVKLLRKTSRPLPRIGR